MRHIVTCSMRLRALVVLLWLAVAIGGVGLSGDLFSRLQTGFGVSAGAESTRVAQTLAGRGGTEPDLVAVAFSPTLPITPAQARTVEDAFADIPLRAGTTVHGIPSADGRAILYRADIATDASATAAADTVRRAGAAAALSVRISGPQLFTQEFSRISEADLARGEAIALPIVLVVVALAMRRAVAGLVPFLVAVLTIPASLLVLALVARATDLNAYSVNVATMVGLALAVDYTVLLMVRHQELLRHEDTTEAGRRSLMVEAASRTARTALYSGAVLLGAMSGLLLFPDPLLRSIGLGAMAVVAMTVLAACTLLPAVLALLGHRLRPRRAQDRGRLVTRLVRLSLRRPTAVAAACLVGLAALAVPAASVVLGGSDASSLPESATARQVSELVDQSFPQLAGASAVLVATDDRVSPEQLARDAARVPGVALATPRDGAGRPAVVEASLEPDLSAAQEKQVVAQLRRTLAGGALVGGGTAALLDFTGSVDRHAPWVALWIALVVLLVVGAMTRSVVLALKAVLLAGLSLGAVLGVLVVAFQGDQGSLDATSVIVTLVFALGLSMDYEVFILQRIAEEHDRGLGTAQAVVEGLRRVGPAVSIAAMLMVVVFIGFGTSEIPAVRVIGWGLAAAIVLDATLVRFMLLPATMALLREWNWWPGGSGRSEVDAPRGRTGELLEPRSTGSR